MTAYVLGVGTTAFTRMTERRIEDVGAEAIVASLDDAGIGREHLEAVFCGSVFGGVGIGQRLMREVGVSRIPIMNTENACASSGVALRQAVAWIESGAAGLVLVVGIEMLTQLGGGLVQSDARGLSAEVGLTLPGLYAMHAHRYLSRWGATAEDLALVAVKNRSNGALNPKAHFQTPVSLAEVLASPMIADPLTRLQCCPNVDGASALVVSAEALSGARAIRIAGWGMTSGNDLDIVGSEPEATRAAAQIAYETAGIGPEDIDVCELHEPFTIAEIEHSESLGFAEAGSGARFVREGRFDIGSPGVAINPSGGLLARGHPLGASGGAQIVELVTQLRGEAGPRQVAGARTGLAHIMGGNIPEIDSSACVVHVLTS